MYGVPDFLNKRAPTHQVSITGLHPLDRHDEGMIGQLTRWDMGGKASRGGVENVHYMVKCGVLYNSFISLCLHEIFMSWNHSI